MGSVAAVSTIRGDLDVAPLTIRHLFTQGVDSVWVAAGDEQTLDALQTLAPEFPDLYLFDASRDAFHEQQRWTDELAGRAAVMTGGDWILPFDADEFWIAPQFGSLKDAFDHAPTNPHVILQARLWHHHTWDDKVAEPEALPKVAYRWSGAARIGPGAHSVWVPEPSITVDLGVQVRHLQYRSFEHFCEKVRDRNERLAPYARDRGDGAHHTRYENADATALREGWRTLEQRLRVHDPIPVIT